MIRHQVYFDTLGTMKEDSASWRSVFAGLSVLRLVDSYADSGASIDPANWAQLHSVRSAIEAVGEGDPVRGVLSTVLEQATKRMLIDDVVCGSLLAYGRALDYEASWALAIDVFSSVAKLARPDRNPKLAVEANVLVGGSARRNGDWDTSARAYSQAAFIADTLGDREGVLTVQVGIANTYIAKGNLPQAQTILDQTRARVEALHIQRSQSEHAIAALLGRPVAGFAIAVATTLPLPPVIPAGVPADLLGRRPDIASAERLAASASAQIGVAKAAYLPQISLTGLAGYESTNPASLVNWQNSIASMAASAVAPVFTGGRLKANVDQAQAFYRQSVAQYEKTVLVAYQDVEDQLAALHYLSNQFDAESSAVADAKRAEEIASNRYNTGLVSYLDVVFAEQTLLANQEISMQVQGQRMMTTVALIRALGGSWNN